MPPLGYLYDAYDQRNLDFPFGQVIPTVSKRRRRTWPVGRWHADQLETSSCVGMGFTQILKDYPVGQGRTMPDPWRFAYDNYREAQRIDPWNGGDERDDDGTVLDAMGRILLRKKKIKSFHFALSMDDIILALLEHGPVVFGTRWYSGMSQPDREGMMHVTGSLQGGHAWKADMIDLTRGVLRKKGSWGRGWAMGGYALISLEAVEELVFRRNGECCLVVE